MFSNQQEGGGGARRSSGNEHGEQQHEQARTTKGKRFGSSPSTRSSRRSREQNHHHHHHNNNSKSAFAQPRKNPCLKPRTHTHTKSTTSLWAQQLHPCTAHMTKHAPKNLTAPSNKPTTAATTTTTTATTTNTSPCLRVGVAVDPVIVLAIPPRPPRASLPLHTGDAVAPVGQGGAGSLDEPPPSLRHEDALDQVQDGPALAEHEDFIAGVQRRRDDLQENHHLHELVFIPFMDCFCFSRQFCLIVLTGAAVRRQSCTR